MSDKLMANGTAIRIQDSLVDLFILVGLDDNTSLIPSQKVDSVLLEDLYDQDYEPQVLAAVSATTMMHFFPYPRQDMEYPSINLNGSSGEFSSQQGRTIKRTLLNQRSVTKTPANINRLMSIRRPHGGGKSTMNASHTQFSFNNTDFPVSEEVINAITTFCFPDNMMLYASEPDSFAHYLVLTNMSGMKTYATCLTFYRPFVVEKDEQGYLYMNLDTTNETLTEHQYRCYIPHCGVFISKFPYFTTMKDILSYMVSLINKKQDDMLVYIKEFTHTLTMTPVPPAGPVAVEINLHHNLPFTIYPPENADKPVIDLPLHLVFTCFHDDQILQVLSALFMEERIIFVSSSYALLTTIMESFLSFLLPFRWRYTYVPILSVKALDLMDAPGTFIMGCHLKHQNLVEQIDGLVVVNIDDGTVTVNPERNMQRHEIPSLPREPAISFKKVCRRARTHFELKDVQRPTCHDVVEEKKIQQARIRKLNAEIEAGCLELMVNLFRGVVFEVRVEHGSFNKQKFLESQGKVPADLMFYKEVLQKDMFKSFLDDRLQDKSDYWTEHEMRTRQYIRRASLSDVRTPQVHSSKYLQKRLSLSIIPNIDLKKSLVVVKLPQHNSPSQYLASCISSLDRNLQTSEDSQERASYLYLRAVFKFSDHDTVGALSDIITLATIDWNLLPKLLFHEIHSVLTAQDIQTLSKVQGYSSIVNVLKDENQSMDSTIRRYHGHDGVIIIPNDDLLYEVFRKYVSLYDMTQDCDTIKRLFEALTGLERETRLPRETFQAFCLCWLENQEQCVSVMKERQLQTDESVLKVSSLCKTDYGTGRVLLTDKRLLFMRDASKRLKDIVKLRDIQLLEKVQLHSFLSVEDALRIHRHVPGKVEHNKFTVWLKEERNHFTLLIQEMWAGKVISDATKDIVVIHQAAQNVLLVDTIIESGEDETCCHHDTVESSADHLCSYTRAMERGDHLLSLATKEALQQKLDPNLGELDRNSVQALLYTPGDADTHVSPKLWCGLINAKVRVFDGMTWTLEKEFVQAKNSLSCLTAVGKRQVWVGSYEIYIIETETIQSKCVLCDHGEFVIDIIAVEDSRYVYSASVNGVIIRWHVKGLTVANRISLDLSVGETLRKLQYAQGYLWCGVWRGVWQISTEGSVLGKFDFTLPKTPAMVHPVEMECFHVMSDGQIWAGCRKDGTLVVMDTKNKGKIIETIKLELELRGISVMVKLDDRMWVGTKSGVIFVVDIKTREVKKQLKAHCDAVRALCRADKRYILSGAGSADGKIAIWNPQDTRSASGRFLLE